VAEVLSNDVGALDIRASAGPRRHFAMVLALALAAIVAVAAYSYIAIHGELTESALSRRASLSDLTAATLSEKFKRAVDVSISLATRVRFRDLIEAGEWTVAARILRDAPADFEFAERIGLIDLQGALLAGVPEVPVPGRQNFADRDWFQAARGGKTHVSHIFKRAAPPQENVFVAAVPIRSSKGDLLGVLALQMAVARFFDWIRAIDIGPDGLIYVVDSRGMLAFHPTLPTRSELVDFSSVPAVRQALQGKRGVESMFNPVEKAERVAAFAPVPGSGWGVVVAESSAAVFETRNRLLGLAVVAYLLVLALFAAFIANRMILQRERAAESARLIAESERRAEDVRRHAQDTLARHGERLSVVREIDRAIVAEVKPEAIAAAVLQPLRDLLDVPRVNVNMLDLDAGEAEWMASAGRRRVHVGGGVRFPMSFLGDVEALKRGESQTIDTRALPLSPERDALLASGVNYYLAVPMIAGGELIGALSFGGERGVFPEDQVLIAREVAMQLGIAITQARLFERIKHQAEELEQRVRERTSQLEASNKELESFSYSVSHDLRAPLRAVDGYALMLAEDYGDRLDDEGRRLLAVVRASAGHMGQLIDDLLRFSQVGRRPLEQVLVDMRALAGEVVAAATQQHPKVRVELGALPAAMGDRSLLRQVWSNLVGNAIKYSTRADLPRVEISARSNRTEIIYTVRDNGAGFDMRYYDKLFNVFQRLHSSEEFEGTGVGLAIVQRVVSRHGGRVWGEGDVGAGASFHFALPKES